MSRSITPSHDYGAVPPPNASHMGRGYGAPADTLDTGVTDFAPTAGKLPDSSPLSQSLQHSSNMQRFTEDFDASVRGSSIIEGDGLNRSASVASQSQTLQGTPSRSGTLKKRGSVKRNASLKRSGSKKSLRAGSIKGFAGDGAGDDSPNSYLYIPIPTNGSPTAVLADRFQAWRKFLKDIITYFREIQTSYEQRAKSLLKVSNVVNNLEAPAGLLSQGGLENANRILRDFHKQSISEANKARDIENEVIKQLDGLRSDLNSKIKEIKSLSGDFKNKIEKEVLNTKHIVDALQDAIALVDHDPAAVSGKNDPYVIRLGVERQLEIQIDEENYLHGAYINIERSGRELEAIIVGEIQKAWNALASILKKEADETYNVVELLRSGPISLDKDHEWTHFVYNDPSFVDPSITPRNFSSIEYPGKHHPAAAEVRAGMLERKSKYLKSYTPGWYVLSPTHLHEFKSADHIYSHPPIMSLYLLDQKLGSHSQPGSSSHKFMLKGRQTGSIHRGHSWVFRAESYDTMLAWYDAIKTLTETSGEARNNFVRRHARSVSGGSARSITSGSELEEDPADEVPYSVQESIASQQLEKPQPQAKRPSPGGRFPSDLQVNRHLHAPLSQSSGSSDVEHDLTAAAGGLQGSEIQHQFAGAPEQSSEPNVGGRPEIVEHSIVTENPVHNPQSYTLPVPGPAPAVASEAVAGIPQPVPSQSIEPQPTLLQPGANLTQPPQPPRHNSMYGDWMAPTAGAVAAGVVGSEVYRQSHKEEEPEAVELPSTEPPRNTEQIIPITTSTSTNLRPASDVTSPASILTDSTTNVPGPAGNHPLQSEPVQSSNVDTDKPGMQRHTTGLSVSDLHVPGEYPKGRAGSNAA